MAENRKYEQYWVVRTWNDHYLWMEHPRVPSSQGGRIFHGNGICKFHKMDLDTATKLYNRLPHASIHIDLGCYHTWGKDDVGIYRHIVCTQEEEVILGSNLPEPSPSAGG